MFLLSCVLLKDKGMEQKFCLPGDFKVLYKRRSNPEPALCQRALTI